MAEESAAVVYSPRLAESPACGLVFEGVADLCWQGMWVGEFPKEDDAVYFYRAKEGDPVGVLVFADEGRELRVRLIFVDETARKTGVMKALVRALQGTAQAQGKRLAMDVSPKNVPFHTIARKLGVTDVVRYRLAV